MDLFQEVRNLICKQRSALFTYPIITKEKNKGKTHDIIIYRDNKPVLIVL